MKRKGDGKKVRKWKRKRKRKGKKEGKRKKEKERERKRKRERERKRKREGKKEKEKEGNRKNEKEGKRKKEKEKEGKRKKEKDEKRKKEKEGKRKKEKEKRRWERRKGGGYFFFQGHFLCGVRTAMNSGSSGLIYQCKRGQILSGGDRAALSPRGVGIRPVLSRAAAEEEGDRPSCPLGGGPGGEARGHPRRPPQGPSSWVFSVLLVSFAFWSCRVPSFCCLFGSFEAPPTKPPS